MPTAKTEGGERTLLIDGDVLAYRVAAAVQKIEQDDFGYLRPFASVVEGQGTLDNLINSLMQSLKATHMRMVLSDPNANWRKELAPTYKQNRVDLHRPLLLSNLKTHLRDKYGAFWWEGLEADDTLGILATEPQEHPGDRVVVGKDKDFQCIPGKHHVIGNKHEGQLLINVVTPAFAQNFHMIQTLAGDRIDGYGGCPGIGMERAARIVEEPKLLVPEDGVVTRGPRKGQRTVKWMSEPTADLWACVVSHYKKAGLKEKDALLSARLAHILHHEDYDRVTQQITLWTPEKMRRQ